MRLRGVPVNNVKVKASESGCWQVLRNDILIDIYPSHMWRAAYNEARREAIWQNLGIAGMEVTA